MKKELLNKYLTNSCTASEFDEFAEWVNSEALSEDGKAIGFEDWRTFNLSQAPKNASKYNILLDKIHHQINLQERPSPGNRSLWNNRIGWLSRVAAVLFLPLLGVLFYMMVSDGFYPKTAVDNTLESLEIIAPIGSRTVVHLADGTVVNLNHGSRIKYPSNFKNDIREVELVGEGYFEVAHNPDRPFIVKTGILNVKVLGTKFNLSAYPDENIIATTLVEGKVVLEKDVDGQSVQSIGSMIPGQHVEYNRMSQEISSTVGSTEKYTSWIDGKFVFDKEPLSLVAEELGRTFNVDFELDDEVKSYTYTVTFKDESLFLILDLMTEITPVSYSIIPREKQSDGTYARKLIKIEKRK
ncbi:FecR family protein [Mangrovibacterium sp.]|uniref:FecR family protein n=1 Tax=Mangrovibacterium sp. TaxID=1961364 RepID=UPI003568E6FF